MRYFFIFITFLTLPLSTEAARLTFEAERALMPVGGVVPVTLYLDTEGVQINAVEGSVRLSENLSIAGIREAESVVSLWVARPSSEGNASTFSGVIPGGFLGELSPFWEGPRPGALYTLLVEGSAPGEGRIWIAPGALVLAHDGRGTPITVSTDTLALTVSQTAPPGDSDYVDEERPETFAPMVARDQDMFGGAYFLVFATNDGASGIDHYEVAESRWGAPELAVFERVESPYLIKDQSLRSYIYVKAVDRAGNEELVVVPPAHQPLAAYVWPILTGAAILALIGYLIRRRHAD